MVAAGQAWQSLIQTSSEQQASRCLAPQRNLGSIDSKNTRIAARGAVRRNHGMTRYKPQFHQPAGVLIGQIDAIQDPGLAAFQFGQISRRPFKSRCFPFETHLQIEI